MGDAHMKNTPTTDTAVLAVDELEEGTLPRKLYQVTLRKER